MNGDMMDDSGDMMNESFYDEPDKANPHGINRFPEGGRPAFYVVPRWESHGRMRPANRGEGRMKSYLPEDVYVEPDQANPYGIPRPPI